MDAIFRILALPLNWFYHLTNNYVIALILYAVLIKIALFPLGIKQQKGMVKQASMRPKEMAIRKRYAGRTDKKTQMKMQEDLQKLYQDEGYNPLSGCGPMLIQLPIIFILYRIIYEPLSYIVGMGGALVSKVAETAGMAASNHIPILEVIKDKFADFSSLAVEGGEKFTDFFADSEAFGNFFDGFKAFGINLAQVPNTALDSIKNNKVENWAETIILLAIPVLVFASQWISMKVIRKMSYQSAADGQTASSMKIMDFVMPLMTLFFAFSFSGLLGIYWILNSILSMIQQIILKKMYPIPVFTEEDYKAAEKAMNGKLKPAKKSNGKKKHNPNSLHHIDDDDDEEDEVETPKPAPKKDKPKGNALIEPAKVKDSKREEPSDEGAEEAKEEIKEDKEGN